MDIERKNDHIAACGANYMVSDEFLETEKVSYANIEIGTKVTKIGSKKRSSFSLKEHHWMRYDGIYDDGKYRYIIFRTEFMEQKIDNRYWCYAFIIIGSSLNKLYRVNSNYMSGSDIVIDEFKVFIEKF